MSKFLRSLLLQDWCYFVCLACTKAKIFYCPSQICCGKSGTDSWYSGFCGRFWFPYLSSLHNGHIQNASEKPQAMKWWYMKRWDDASDKGFNKANKRRHIEVFWKKKEKRFYSLHDIPFAMLLLIMFGPKKKTKSLEVFNSKSRKNTIHFYCSWITVHGLLFTFIIHDTVHSEILPI